MQETTLSEQETTALAARLAPHCRTGDVLCLDGPLGIGKSVFARGLIRALAGQADLEVPSPTFTLVQTYDTPRFPVWHFDLYRLQDPEEMIELGWEDAKNEALSLIEWPERLGVFRPQDRLDIVFSAPDASSRLIAFTPCGLLRKRAFP